MFKPIAIAAVFAVFAMLAGKPAQAQPEITVSIKPVHSLVAGVTRGVTEPYLLIPGSASPHAYSLKPSDARALETADVVFWVGEGLETFMIRPLEALADKAKVVPLGESRGVTLLDARDDEDWDGHAHHQDDEHAHDGGHDHAHGDEHAHTEDHDHGHEHGSKDMHIWLDPDNARAMVAHIVEVLSETDPANAETYRQNGEEMGARLNKLSAELSETLAPVKDEPFLVFHDAYHYFDAAFDLNAVGSITISPEVQPSARRVREIGEKIRKAGVTCIFAEPQFEPSLIGVVMEGTDARSDVLDPLGAEIAAGPDLYFALMRQNARAVAGCLSG